MILPFELCGQVPTRYFSNGGCVWKFAPYAAPETRLIKWTEWTDSMFKSLSSFLASAGAFWEITAEEGEP